MRLIDLTGQQFGRLVVLERAENYRHTIYYPDGSSKNTSATRWKCYCDPKYGGCGKITTVLGQGLRRGTTRSCGCLNKELLRKKK